MKRFLRYLLPIFCIGILSLWGRSGFRRDTVVYVFSDKSLSMAQSGEGLIYFVYGSTNHTFPRYGIHFFHGQVASSDYVSRFGFICPQDIAALSGLILLVPYWLIFLPISLITLAFWYHPLKAKLRGTDRQGFEVEMKSPSESQQEKV